MHLPRRVSAISAIALLAACVEAPPPFEPIAIDVPAESGAIGPRISGSPELGLVLSWMEKDDSGASVLYARYTEGRWSAPESVVEGIDMFVNWADMPSSAAREARSQ